LVEFFFSTLARTTVRNIRFFFGPGNSRTGLKDAADEVNETTGASHWTYRTDEISATWLRVKLLANHTMKLTPRIRHEGSIHSFLNLRYSARCLWRDPRFAALVILTFALAVGANVATFSVVYGLLFRPFSYKGPDRLVAIGEIEIGRNSRELATSLPTFLDWRDRAESFQALGAYSFYGPGFQLKTENGTELLNVLLCNYNLFDVLGIQPVLGRSFAEEEADLQSVVILTHNLWVRHFSADPNIVGKVLKGTTASIRVIGVLPPGFKIVHEEAFLAASARHAYLGC
jgi:hypothetical protein